MQSASAAAFASVNCVTGSRCGSFTGAEIEDVCCGAAAGIRTARVNPGPSPTAIQNSEAATKPSPLQMSANRRPLPLEGTTQECVDWPVDGVAPQSFCLSLAMKPRCARPNRLQFRSSCRPFRPHRNRRRQPGRPARRFSTGFPAAFALRAKYHQSRGSHSTLKENYSAR